MLTGAATGSGQPAGRQARLYRFYNAVVKQERRFAPTGRHPFDFAQDRLGTAPTWEN